MPYTILTEMTDKPITSFDEASQYLNRFYVNASAKYNLDNMLALMEHLDNPQEKFKIVHVAGTSGKTSTVYYVSALLAATGRKVGLTVSPHVDHINERLQINNVPLDETEFCAALTEYLELIEASPAKPSWFEAMIAFAYWYFAKSQVDYAVIEVGLGGLLDGTNVIKRSDKVCVITDIGYDHMSVLGNTLPEIAAQKIGIVHPGNAVFSYRQAQEIMAIFANWCLRHSADLHVVEELADDEYDSRLPAYQYRNWNLAYEIFKYVANRDNLQHLTSQVLSEVRHLQVPGRMDIRQVGDKTLVMDGAHNAQKMTAFLGSFKKLYPDARPAVLLSLKNGKEYEQLIPLLKPIASRFILTTFDVSQDVPAHSMDIDELVEAFKSAGVEAANIPDQRQAYQALVSGPDKVCVITGSFYLLNQIRNNEHLV
jgi:dihydrofolate synthase/folylpolyglutamate synthase